MYEIDFDVADMELTMKRRKVISKIGPLCPVCGTEQVQLVNWLYRLCDMKCRRCKQKFVVDSGV